MPEKSEFAVSRIPCHPLGLKSEFTAARRPLHPPEFWKRKRSHVR